MKRAVLIALLVLSLMLALAACGQNAAVEEASAPAEEEGSVSMANPWREVTQEEAQAACTRSFNIPEGAENVKWSIMDAAADPSGVAGAMVQAVFDRSPEIPKWILPACIISGAPRTWAP